MGSGVDSWPIGLPDWGAELSAPNIGHAARNPYAYDDGDGMPGTYWISATNLYGEPTSVPVFPTRPTDPGDWNPAGFSF